MARDLARAQASQPKMAESPKPPVLDISPKPVPPAPPQKPLAISDILAQARKRAEVRPPLPPQPSTQKPIEDILPIEEKEERPPRLLTPERSDDEQAKMVEPPDNLPIEEGLPKIAKPPQAPLPAPPKPPTPLPQPPKSAAAPKLMTPEEILGLSARLPRPAGSGGQARPPEIERPASPPPPKASETKKQPPIQIPAPPKPARPISRLKFALATGTLGLISILVIGGVIWKIFIQPPPAPPTPAPIGPTTQPLPKSLLNYPLTQIEEVEISQLSYDALKPKLDALQGFLPDTLAYIPLKIRTEKEIRYLTLAELFSVMQVDAPPAFFTYPEYTLFLYTPKPISRTLCEEAGIENSLCYGPRLGLVMKLPEDITSYDIALNATKEWEKTLEEDLQPLMIFVPQKGQQKSFDTGKHGELDTHYLNLPIHTMSIDWILTEKYLVIATSKDAARTALNNLESP